jgi:hypothetical protein
MAKTMIIAIVAEAMTLVDSNSSPYHSSGRGTRMFLVNPDATYSATVLGAIAFNSRKECASIPKKEYHTTS